MSHSVSRPYGKWYESSFRFLFGFRGFTNDEMELLRAEMEQDEKERLRAADMMADKFVENNWSLFEITILPPNGGLSSWDIFKHKCKIRDEMTKMIRNFWRERV